ncbi:CSLREA domain-containing protein [Ilumatobacter fluminis]|uniref:CSLREA domain-containing protein n=1 Tax=Ilumatobacter fluminis TaxID=467091 RepID=A0A4R7HWJ8_9ACTN|nr:CSLREA domain-containing protein [Ilumatobacter fluminis]TDT15391.1 CSLREA domain-containing protein [Ilumatobacter fluminis]
MARSRTGRALTTASGLLLAGAVAIGADSASAAVEHQLTVDTTDDTVDADPGDGACADASGSCSLRAAVQEAEASSGAAHISLPAGEYRFTLANTGGDEDAGATGDLDVSTDIRISGFGATIDTDWLDRGFDVAESGNLVLSGLSIINGYAPGGADPVVGSGGAIANAGSTTLQIVSFVGNRAEGPAASGGAILNTGELSVWFSTFDGNRATRAGGAIEANGGTTNIVGSTFVENTTGPEPGNGGAFHLTGEGQVTVSGSTFRGNTATAEGGALWNSASGTMVVANSSIDGNTASGAEADQGGGGVFNDGGTMTISGSTIFGNIADGEAGSGGGVLNNDGTVDIESTDIVGNTSNRAGGGIEANVGTTDLDFVRLEANRTGSAPGNGGGFHITGAGNSDIRNSTVIRNEAAAEGGGLWNGVGTMTVVDTQVSFNTAAGPAADQGGGGLFNAGGTLVVDGGSIDENTATGEAGSGGGILNDQGTLEVTGTEIADNSSVRAGGGIEANVGTTTIDDVNLFRNTTGGSPGNGGGLHITGAGDATVSNSNISFNTAAAEGGGLWNGTGTMVVTDSFLNTNTASGDEADQGGGGLFNAGGTLEVRSTKLFKNVADGASGSGGGILNDQGDLTVEDSNISRNESMRAGGGIEANIGTTTLVEVRLEANSTGAAPGNGGGLHISGAGTADITDGRVFRNSAAKEGGGLWNSATGTLTVSGTDIRKNTAPAGPDVFTVPGGDTTIG